MDISDLDKTCLINIITDTRVKFFERTLFQMFFVHVRGKTINNMHKCCLAWSLFNCVVLRRFSSI